MNINLQPNSRLIAFGDSWTQGHGIELDIHCKEVISPNPFIDKLRNGNGWPRHLANILDIPFVNFGWCNYSNKNIITEIKNNLIHLEKNDLIIVMLSYPYRDDSRPDEDVPVITELLKNYNYFIVNSFYKTFADTPIEITNTIELSRFLNKEVTMVNTLMEYEKTHNVSVWEYNFRYPQNWQNTLYGDTHPNYLGYKIIAQTIHNLILEHDNDTNSSTQ